MGAIDSISIAATSDACVPRAGTRLVTHTILLPSFGHPSVHDGDAVHGSVHEPGAIGASMAHRVVESEAVVAGCLLRPGEFEVS